MMKRTAFVFCLPALLVTLGFANEALAFYNPAVGRWMTRDPIGYANGFNFYEYVRSKCIKHKDPLGLDMMGFAKVFCGRVPP